MGLELILILAAGAFTGVALARAGLNRRVQGPVNSMLTLVVLIIITLVGARAGHATRMGIVDFSPLYISVIIVLASMALSLLASLILIRVLRE